MNYRNERFVEQEYAADKLLEAVREQFHLSDLVDKDEIRRWHRPLDLRDDSVNRIDVDVILSDHRTLTRCRCKSVFFTTREIDRFESDPQIATANFRRAEAGDPPLADIL